VEVGLLAGPEASPQPQPSAAAPVEGTLVLVVALVAGPLPANSGEGENPAAGLPAELRFGGAEEPGLDQALRAFGFVDWPAEVGALPEPAGGAPPAPKAADDVGPEAELEETLRGLKLYSPTEPPAPAPPLSRRQGSPPFEEEWLAALARENGSGPAGPSEPSAWTEPSWALPILERRPDTAGVPAGGTVAEDGVWREEEVLFPLGRSAVEGDLPALPVSGLDRHESLGAEERPGAGGWWSANWPLAAGGLAALAAAGLGCWSKEVRGEDDTTGLPVQR
jgi:hypothetical protein